MVPFPTTALSQETPPASVREQPHRMPFDPPNHPRPAEPTPLVTRESNGRPLSVPASGPRSRSQQLRRAQNSSRTDITCVLRCSALQFVRTIRGSMGGLGDRPAESTSRSRCKVFNGQQGRAVAVKWTWLVPRSSIERIVKLPIVNAVSRFAFGGVGEEKSTSVGGGDIRRTISTVTPPRCNTTIPSDSHDVQPTLRGVLSRARCAVRSETARSHKTHIDHHSARTTSHRAILHPGTGSGDMGHRLADARPRGAKRRTRYAVRWFGTPADPTHSVPEMYVHGRHARA